MVDVTLLYIAAFVALNLTFNVIKTYVYGQSNAELDHSEGEGFLDKIKKYLFTIDASNYMFAVVTAVIFMLVIRGHSQRKRMVYGDMSMSVTPSSLFSDELMTPLYTTETSSIPLPSTTTQSGLSSSMPSYYSKTPGMVRTRTQPYPPTSVYSASPATSSGTLYTTNSTISQPPSSIYYMTSMDNYTSTQPDTDFFPSSSTNDTMYSSTSDPRWSSSSSLPLFSSTSV